MAEHPFPLEEQICFTLYRTSMAINRTYKPMLDAMGITYPQYLMLNVLGEQDGRTIGAIAARLALESSTVTPAVKRMEAAGLLTRRRDAADERQVQVWLTDEGRALLSRSACLGQTLLQRSGLSPDQLQALNRQIQALDAALQAATDE
ncbi:MarR family winged helix-turn-helix transcriptional regulator [Aquabacter cavernae]|uniref:MarR family winged helix-turn-helix transcriptional regulator n=1 Tax=Aquabacter cavernae TaxID=2496029 RepID=UPI000F8DC56F|nr:MarR family transcriptional regulator [Aquabacter cavernae]